MIKYLLDTNICIFYFKKHRNITQLLSQIDPENCFISEISVAELYFGAVKSHQERHFRKIADLLTLIKVVPMYDTIKTYSDIRYYVEKNGKPIDNFDLLIAAAAITNDMTLVTDNTKHFARIPGLKLVNWA